LQRGVRSLKLGVEGGLELESLVLARLKLGLQLSELVACRAQRLFARLQARLGGCPLGCLLLEGALCLPEPMLAFQQLAAQVLQVGLRALELALVGEKLGTQLPELALERAPADGEQSALELSCRGRGLSADGSRRSVAVQSLVLRLQELAR
jgi:hypothetical protein